MIYEGNDEILRSICQKIEDSLSLSMFTSIISPITTIKYFNNKLYIRRFPFPVTIYLTIEEQNYIEDKGSITVMTNRAIFKDELGYGYFTLDNKDDVHRRFTTKEQATRELYRYYTDVFKDKYL